MYAAASAVTPDDRLGRDARRPRHPVHVVVQPVDQRGIRPAQLPGALDDGAEDRVEVRPGATQRRQHLTRGGEVAAGLRELSLQQLSRFAD
ncbi:MAG TPA: hypothetical protein VFV76_09705 [Actinomycetes bacterium]|nr:hypothetical protein [Actinomycetes bacterium]